MVAIHNSDLKREIIEGAKMQLSVDKVPQELAEKVLPVMEVNPKLLRTINIVKGETKTTTGNLDIYKTPPDKDFYLTSINGGLVKDATCDAVTGQIPMTITLNGVVQKIFPFSIITLTAQEAQQGAMFFFPLKLDRNSVIRIGGAFTVGAMVRNLSFTGYTVDD